jgi:ParB family transcriptional regulator, chromosome partitioning protein
VATQVKAAQQTQLIDLTKLEVHPANPRQNVGDVSDIAESIDKVGQLSPLLAVKHNGSYQVVDGSRRLAALRQAGKAQAQVRVLEADEADAAAIAIISNIQRADLSALEEAAAYAHWLQLTGKTQSDLAREVGRAPSTIANALRLLKAPAFVQDALNGKKLTPAHAKVLLQVKDPAQYDDIAKELGKRAEKVTVDELHDIVESHNDSYATRGPGAVAAAKAFLEDARAKHPKAVITWKAKSEQWADVLDLGDALGEPPARIAGRVWYAAGGQVHTAVTPEIHKKHCDCDAYAIVAERDYGGAIATPTEGRLKLELQRVCVVSKNYRQAKPPKPKRTSYSSSGTLPAKPPTPAQLAARRKQAETLVKRGVAALAKPRDARYAPIFSKLRKGTMPVDLARAIAYVGLCGYHEGSVYDGLGQQIAWQRLAKMSAKQVSEIAANAISSAFQDTIWSDLSDADREGADAAPVKELAAYFGVKLPEPKKAKKAR